MVSTIDKMNKVKDYLVHMGRQADLKPAYRRTIRKHAKRLIHKVSRYNEYKFWSNLVKTVKSAKTKDDEAIAVVAPYTIRPLTKGLIRGVMGNLPYTATVVNTHNGVKVTTTVDSTINKDALAKKLTDVVAKAGVNVVSQRSTLNTLELELATRSKLCSNKLVYKRYGDNSLYNVAHNIGYLIGSGSDTTSVSKGLFDYVSRIGSSLGNTVANAARATYQKLRSMANVASNMAQDTLKTMGFGPNQYKVTVQEVAGTFLVIVVMNPSAMIGGPSEIMGRLAKRLLAAGVLVTAKNVAANGFSLELSKIVPGFERHVPSIVTPPARNNFMAGDNVITVREVTYIRQGFQNRWEHRILPIGQRGTVMGVYAGRKPITVKFTSLQGELVIPCDPQDLQRVKSYNRLRVQRWNPQKGMWDTIRSVARSATYLPRALLAGLKAIYNRGEMVDLIQHTAKTVGISAGALLVRSFVPGEGAGVVIRGALTGSALATFTFNMGMLGLTVLEIGDNQLRITAKEELKRAVKSSPNYVPITPNTAVKTTTSVFCDSIGTRPSLIRNTTMVGAGTPGVVIRVLPGDKYEVVFNTPDRGQLAAICREEDIVRINHKSTRVRVQKWNRQKGVWDTVRDTAGKVGSAVVGTYNNLYSKLSPKLKTAASVLGLDPSKIKFTSTLVGGITAGKILIDLSKGELPTHRVVSYITSQLVDSGMMVLGINAVVNGIEILTADPTKVTRGVNRAGTKSVKYRVQKWNSRKGIWDTVRNTANRVGSGVRSGASAAASGAGRAIDYGRAVGTGMRASLSPAYIRQTVAQVGRSMGNVVGGLVVQQIMPSTGVFSVKTGNKMMAAGVAYDLVRHFAALGYQVRESRRMQDSMLFTFEPKTKSHSKGGGPNKSNTFRIQKWNKQKGVWDTLRNTARVIGREGTGILTNVGRLYSSIGRSFASKNSLLKILTSIFTSNGIPMGVWALAHFIPGQNGTIVLSKKLLKAGALASIMPSLVAHGFAVYHKVVGNDVVLEIKPNDNTTTTGKTVKLRVQKWNTRKGVWDTIRNTARNVRNTAGNLAEDAVWAGGRAVSGVRALPGALRAVPTAVINTARDAHAVAQAGRVGGFNSAYDAAQQRFPKTTRAGVEALSATYHLTRHMVNGVKALLDQGTFNNFLARTALKVGIPASQIVLVSLIPGKSATIRIAKTALKFGGALGMFNALLEAGKELEVVGVIEDVKSINMQIRARYKKSHNRKLCKGVLGGIGRLAGRAVSGVSNTINDTIGAGAGYAGRAAIGLGSRVGTLATNAASGVGTLGRAAAGYGYVVTRGIKAMWSYGNFKSEVAKLILKAGIGANAIVLADFVPGNSATIKIAKGVATAAGVHSIVSGLLGMGLEAYYAGMDDIFVGIRVRLNKDKFPRNTALNAQIHGA